jgi:acetyl esterase/lipase
MTTRRGFIGQVTAQAAGIGAASLLGAQAWSQALPAAAGDSPQLSAQLQHVHPELRRAAQVIMAMPPRVFSQAGLPAMRSESLSSKRETRQDVPVQRRMLAGRRGQSDVAVYVVNARADAKRGAILHMHGGGFVLGRAENGVATLQNIAAQLDCVIVTVDYRLAPEARWNESLEDNYTALAWLHANAASLGADPQRIAVMGESAGGGHAAMLAIAARDRGEIALALQCLTYPMLDDRTGSTRTLPPHVGQLLWTAESNRFGWTSILGVPAGSAEVPAAAVPARCQNLTGLAPAFICVGGIDLFVDEDIAYAQRLNAAGVATELLLLPGAFHAFDKVVPGSTPTKVYEAARLAALRTAFVQA